MQVQAHSQTSCNAWHVTSAKGHHLLIIYLLVLQMLTKSLFAAAHLSISWPALLGTLRPPFLFFPPFAAWSAEACAPMPTSSLLSEKDVLACHTKTLRQNLNSYSVTFGVSAHQDRPIICVSEHLSAETTMQCTIAMNSQTVLALKGYHPL